VSVHTSDEQSEISGVQLRISREDPSGNRLWRCSSDDEREREKTELKITST